MHRLPICIGFFAACLATFVIFMPISSAAVRATPVAIQSSYVVGRLEMAATRLLDYFSTHSFSESGGQPLSANQKSAGSLFGRGLVGTGCECDCFRRPADVDHVVRGGAERDPTVYFNEVFVGQPVGA